MSISIVTAFFDIGRGDWTPDKGLPHYLHRTTDTYVERFGHLATLENEITIFTSEDLIPRVKDKFKIARSSVILINEGQFFPDLVNTITRWVNNYSVNIIVGGLDGDYQRKPMGEILDLIPYADKYKKFCGYCTLCNNETKALFSKRIVNNCDDQILIGGSEKYIPVCRYHYMN